MATTATNTHSVWTVPSLYYIFIVLLKKVRLHGTLNFVAVKRITFLRQSIDRLQTQNLSRKKKLNAYMSDMHQIKRNIRVVCMRAQPSNES